MRYSFFLGLDGEEKAVETTDHVMLLGGPGTSKTYAMRHNLIENENVNVLVIDVLGALYSNTAKLKQAQGYEVVSLNVLESIDLSQISRLNSQEKVAIYITADTKELRLEHDQLNAEKMTINLDHVLQVLMTDQKEPLRLFIDHFNPFLYIPTLPKFLTLMSPSQCQVIMSLSSIRDLIDYPSVDRVHVQSQIHTVALMGTVDDQSVDMIGSVDGQRLNVHELSKANSMVPGSYLRAIVCQREPDQAFTAQWVNKEYDAVNE